MIEHTFAPTFLDSAAPPFDDSLDAVCVRTLGALVDLADDALMLTDADMVIVAANPAVRDLFGVAPDQIVGRSVELFIPARYRAMHRRLLDGFHKGVRDAWLTGAVRRITALHACGDEFQVQVAIAATRIGGETLFAMAVRPFAADDRRAKQSQRPARIVEHITDEICVIHAHTLQLLSANRAARNNLGFSPTEIPTLNALDILPALTINRFRTLTRPLLDSVQNDVVFPSVHQRRNGSTYDVELRLLYMADEDPPVFVAIGRDISDWLQVQTQLQRSERYDPVTMLPNRTMSLDRLGTLLADPNPESSLGTVMLVCLDNLKTLADSLGYETLLEATRVISQRLSAACPADHLVGRIGETEFLVIAAQLTEADAIRTLARSILAVLQTRMVISGYTFVPKASLGIARFPHDGADAEDLLQRASLAARIARDDETHSFTFASRDRKRAVRLDLELEGALSRALDENAFKLVFQPIVDVTSWTYSGAEALLRWTNHRFGAIGPDVFVPILERSGLIADVGLWVLDRACHLCRVWDEAGLTGLRVAVNLSPRQVTSGLPSAIENKLAHYGLAPQRLDLEITENIFLRHDAELVEILQRIKAMGVQLSIDDFGTGYSALSYLRRLPLDAIKIDRSFVQDMVNSEEAAAIVRAIAALGHALDRRTLAEGVETEEQLDMLRHMGCHEIQGYLFGPPRPADELVALLRRPPPHRTDQAGPRPTEGNRFVA